MFKSALQRLKYPNYTFETTLCIFLLIIMSIKYYVCNIPLIRLIDFVQTKVIMQVQTIVEKNMMSIVSNKSVIKGCWKIADLGCSSGPNTLRAISNILNIINKTCLKLNNGITLVFQIYLNDLFENDFNTIFKLLPDFIYQQKKGENVGECFISATPGNFYGRLFPNNYIDFFHSSYSLHWLSQVSCFKPNLKPVNHIMVLPPSCIKWVSLTLCTIHIAYTFFKRHNIYFNNILLLIKFGWALVTKKTRFTIVIFAIARCKMTVYCWLPQHSSYLTMLKKVALFLYLMVVWTAFC